jgi:hypothetical protein
LWLGSPTTRSALRWSRYLADAALRGSLTIYSPFRKCVSKAFNKAFHVLTGSEHTVRARLCLSAFEEHVQLAVRGGSGFLFSAHARRSELQQPSDRLRRAQFRVVVQFEGRGNSDKRWTTKYCSS